MGRFLPRFAALCLCIGVFTFGTGHAEVACTDEAGNNLCEGLNSFKDGVEDRRAYDTEGEQDLLSVPMQAGIYPPQSFQVQQESSSGRNMPLWLWAGLGLNKSPDTVTLFRGPTGFAVTFLKPEEYLEEEGPGANIVKGGYRQPPSNSEQTMELTPEVQAKPGQPDSSPESQTQLQALEWIKRRAHIEPQNNLAASQVNSVPEQQPQAEQQQNSRHGLVLGLQQNIIPHQSMIAVSGGTAPLSPDGRAVVHQTWLSALHHHTAPVDNQHKQLHSGLWQAIGEQHKPMVTGSLAGHPLPLTGQPAHGAIAWQYQHSRFLPTSLKREHGGASGKQSQVFRLGMYPQQAAARNVPSDYGAILGHGASTGPTSRASQQQHRMAVTTTLIGSNLVGPPVRVVAETQKPATAQQTQNTITGMEQQATQHQQQASTDAGVATSLVERIAHQQQGAPKDDQRQSVHKPEEPSAQTPQLPGTNLAQNSTQTTVVAQEAGNLATPTNQQQAPKQEAVPGAGTPPHDLSATGSTPAHHQVAVQQQALQGTGAVKK